MSRKPPSDSFTRFTSTAPPSGPSFSSSNPSSSQSSANSPLNTSFRQTTPNLQPNSSSPINPNETPAQRVARLRAAHRAQVANSQLSPVDKLISRGRTFADIAHRVTTYSLLAITGVSTVIAVYGLVSLVSHNRRQKRAWIEREMDRLAEAQKAFLRGEANAEQLHLLEQERAGEEIAKKFIEDKKRRKEEGTWARLKGTFGGLLGTLPGDKGIETPDRQQEVKDLNVLVEQRMEGTSTDQLRPVAVQAGPVEGVGLDEKGRPVPINKVERVKRETGQTLSGQIARIPGQLDVLADNAAEKATTSSQGWWSWIAGGGKSSPSST